MAINPRELDRRTGTSYKRPTTPSNIERTLIETGMFSPGNTDISGMPAGPGPTRPPQPLGGGGGGGGGRGGGGMGMSAQNSFNGYYQKVLQALGGLNAGPDTLTPRINQAVDADVAAARGAYGQVGDRTADPYAGLSFFANQFDPGIAGISGLDPNAAMNAQQSGQSEMDYASQLYNNYAQSMSAVQQSSNDAWNTDKGRDLAAVESQLGAQRSALLTAAQYQREKQAEEIKMRKLEAILSLLGQGWQSGVNVSGIDFGGLL